MYDKQYVEVSLLMIGHQILLNSEDSTSRVLPIKRENNKYRIRFESDFGFNPDSLVTTINQVLSNTEFASGYILEVEQCETSEIVYSYKMGNWDNISIIPCKMRDQPKSCYSLLFTLLNGNEANTAVSNTNSNISSNTNSNASLLIYSLLTILVVLIGGAIFLIRKRRTKSLIDPNLIPMGEYLFDKRNTKLIYDQISTELTSKEADLLILLYKAVNTIVKREVILKIVWRDEGDYIGRTVDVFISKLRKKLEFDSSIKIVNIRGVGYKLVLST